MKYRVEQLASATGVSVDTIRFYQTRGLLQAPEREGRTAVYGKAHVERIRRIRALQKKGLTLAGIRRVLEGRLGRADEDLAAAVAEAQAGGDGLLTLDELAQQCGVPASILRAVEAEGLPIGRRGDGERRYSQRDAQLVAMGLRLLDRGLPLTELLSLARRQHDAARAIAEDAVRLFDEHVRTPIKDRTSDEAEAAAELVEAFTELLPAVTALVADHFRRVLLDVAQEHIEKTGDAAEIAQLQTAEASWRAR